MIDKLKAKQNRSEKSFFSNLRWINDVSKRFARVDRKGRSAVTSVLATLGICFGVMTLIVVMSVMNGFQMSFIDAIMEISSYHLRVTDLPVEQEAELYSLCDENRNIISVTPFYEAQTLMTGKRGRENAAIIRAVNPSIYTQDKGFYEQLKITGGSFDLSEEDSIVMGASLGSVTDTVFSFSGTSPIKMAISSVRSSMVTLPLPSTSA